MNGDYTLSASGPGQACTPDTVRIDVLDLCAEIFQGPDQGSFPALLGRELPELARRAAGCGSSLAGPLAALARVSPFMGARQDISASLVELESTYVSLFVNARDGVRAPLYESCHTQGGRRLMGPPAEVMSLRLLQAGLTLADDQVEPPDHLSIELEYLAFVLNAACDENKPTLTAVAKDFARHVLPAWRRWAEALETSTAAEPDAVFPGNGNTPAHRSEAFFRAAARLTLAALESLTG